MKAFKRGTEDEKQRLRKLHRIPFICRPSLEENYIQLTGECKKIDVQKRFIQIEKTDIYFDDIYSVQID